MDEAMKDSAYCQHNIYYKNGEFHGFIDGCQIQIKEWNG